MSPTATKPAASKPLVREFDYEVEKKHSIRYKEANVPEGTLPTLGSIYVQKSELAKMTNTKRLRVTVEGIG